MANCTPESSSDEELFIIPPTIQKSFTSPMPGVNGHVAPVTLKQPATIRQINGKRYEQTEPESSSSPVKPSSSHKRIAKSLAPLESSSEDEPIVAPKKKKYQSKKKRSRKQDDDEPITPRKKKTKKTKENAETTKKKAKPTKRTKKPKKVYEMPGQKKDTPHELDGGRIFYESLRKQIPTSKMAEEYLLRHGLLPKEEAEKVVERMEEAKIKKSGSTKTSAIKGRRTNSNSGRNATKSKKKSTKTTAKRSRRTSKRGSTIKGKKRKKKIQIMSGESSDDELLMLPR